MSEQDSFPGSVQIGPTLLGVAADMILSLTGALVLTVMMAEGGMNATAEAVAELNGTLGFALAFLPVGLFCTLVGGFVAAIRAPEAEISNSAAVGITAIVTAVLLTLAATIETTLPLWLDLAGLILVVPAAVLGGMAARSMRR